MLTRIFKNAGNKLDNAVKDTERQAANLRKLAYTIQDATQEARKQREQLRSMRDAYAAIASQLATMANAAGFLWHKDSLGRFIFASHPWCKFFWNDSICDVEGFTDEELAIKFLKRYPRGTFTFGKEICVGSDAFAIRKKKRCRFIECGMIRKDPEDPRSHIVLQTDKTPLYDKSGNYIGIVGMAMQLDCEDFKRNISYWVEKEFVEKLSDTLFYIHYANPQKCELPIKFVDPNMES